MQGMPVMTRLICFLLFAVMAFSGSPVMAGDHASREQARALLDKAVVQLTRDGPDKSFAAFNDRNGGFIVKELYVFVFDMDGKYMASGANPRLTGTDARELKDAEGKPLVREMIETASRKGQGEVDYVWLNRADNAVEKKHSLIRRVNDYIVGVGYYVK